MTWQIGVRSSDMVTEPSRSTRARVNGLIRLVDSLQTIVYFDGDGCRSCACQGEAEGSWRTRLTSANVQVMSVTRSRWSYKSLITARPLRSANDPWTLSVGTCSRYEGSAVVHGAQQWNALPLNIRSVRNPATFKKRFCGTRYFFVDLISILSLFIFTYLHDLGDDNTIFVQRGIVNSVRLD
ncbi:hypothetical protein CAPTEDRAFT_212729 [Capitella teleta]|uniref:Uncharacterized protein n=1 Tax=Capitella teleta TaxID=283909 RepID=R7UJ71_CAPTE|nr:hypothetical protein CAPTEDRAFT_212729 [Capitella teleta]|eukprot:ELU06128.1 hypothetical protein CAPTEDRAFT_212729 [Capitella teleta]